MIGSLDGSLGLGHWTEGPGNTRAERGTLYEKLAGTLEGDAWMVGRVTMAEMIGFKDPFPAGVAPVVRPHLFARPGAASYAVAVDPSGRLRFDRPEVEGGHVVVLLGPDVPDGHLQELAAAGVSYVVAEGAALDMGAALDVLGTELGIGRLLLEGGGGINGSLLAAGLVDEISLLLSPAVDGRTGHRTVFEAGAEGLRGRVELALLSCEPMEAGHVHLRYAVHALNKNNGDVA